MQQGMNKINRKQLLMHHITIDQHNNNKKYKPMCNKIQCRI